MHHKQFNPEQSVNDTFKSLSSSISMGKGVAQRVSIMGSVKKYHYQKLESDFNQSRMSII